MSPSGNPPVTIGDTVWLDSNVNGYQDEGEPGLEGITVTLVDQYGVPVEGYDAQVTDSDGHYLFENVPAGVYSVKYDVPEGYTFSAANPLSDTVDRSDPLAGDYAADIDSSGVAAPLELEAGSTVLTFDAGLHLPVSINGTIFVDHNSDGIRDPEETDVIEGAIVMLFNSITYSFVGEAVTDADGTYNFSVEPGTYYVKLLLPSPDYFVSPIVEGGNTFDQTTTETAPVTLNSGDNAVLDGGIYMLASIGGRVWFDSNFNGIQDNGEGPIDFLREPMWVKLYDSVGNLKGETHTSADGFYQFTTDLTPGMYEVEFQKPPHPYSFTFYKAGEDDTVDSDVKASTGRATAALKSGEHNDDIDAGILDTDNGPYYPEWTNDVQVCTNDGFDPAWMDIQSHYFYASKELCCQNHFWWRMTQW